MKKRELILALQRASHRCNKEITEIASQGGLYAPAMAGEGYVGGYRDALQDCILLINNVSPNRRDYWSDL